MWSRATVFWPDAGQVSELESYMDALRKSGDSVGARGTVVADGVPPGWGEPIYGKLDGELAAAMMSINAVKGVEIGDGFASVAQKGTTHRDVMTPAGFLSNHAGGILGGISSGQPMLLSLALADLQHPPARARIPARPRSRSPPAGTTLRRHPRHAHREAMVALVLDRQAQGTAPSARDVGLPTRRRFPAAALSFLEPPSGHPHP